jgi:LacI family transcriptional regulator
MKELTINDIAKEAGVSIATVSRVISGVVNVSEHTRNRVKEVIKKYNFELNSIAQSLSNKRTLTIGVIILDINNLFFSEIIKGINEVAMENNYDILLANSNYSEELELHNIKNFIKRKLDGILITPVSTCKSEGIELLIEKKIPFFTMNCRMNDSEINYITTDNFYGAYLATNYLIKLGHSKIALLNGSAFQGFIERKEGYRKALLEHNIDYSEELVLGYICSNKEDGYILTKRLLSSSKKLTAIFASNDMMAIGAMEAILETGRKIPDDISLIGFDNLSICKNLRVPLTTINQPKYEQGKLAAASLINLINNYNYKGLEGNNRLEYLCHLIIKPELVIRDSCKSIIV